jgi:hypothetical protein
MATWFSADLRKEFMEWMKKEKNVSDKSAREYYYQLVDVTRVSAPASLKARTFLLALHPSHQYPRCICGQAVVTANQLQEPPQPMDKAAMRSFTTEHSDAYTREVGTR